MKLGQHDQRIAEIEKPVELKLRLTDWIREWFELPSRVWYEEQYDPLIGLAFVPREDPVPRRRAWTVVCPDGHHRQGHRQELRRATADAAYCSGGKPPGRRCGKFVLRWLHLTTCPGGRHGVHLIESWV